MDPQASPARRVSREAKPTILAVDDDPQVLSAVARDLRRRYGEHYRIMRAGGADEAHQILDAVAARATPLALVLADQRMPHLNGTELLAEVAERFPRTKRALLTAYADTDAAIEAINRSRVDHYFLKPWDPPEEKLYPVLDDLLDDWRAGWQPEWRGLRVVGDRWSADGHSLREFLGRNQVPFRWFDADSDKGRQIMRAAGVREAALPAVLLEDGTVLAKPTLAELAAKAGLQTAPDAEFYDLLIVGGGPAGLAAAVYGASEGLSVALLDKDAPGGQAGTSSRIENYLGFPSGLSGGDLARRATTQARRFGAELIVPQEVCGVREEGPYRVLTLADGREITGHSVLVATGVSYRVLQLEGLERLTGAGVYYGSSVSDSRGLEQDAVVIVGAGNSAGQAALHLAERTREVVMAVRGDDLGAKMSQYLVTRIEEHPKIRVRLGTEVRAVHGESRLEGVRLEGPGGEEELACASLFIFIGARPPTDWLRGVVALDEYGFVRTGPQLDEAERRAFGERDPYLTETSLPGVFAAGDVRSGSVKRVASAVGEGSITVQFVHRYLAPFGGDLEGST